VEHVLELLQRTRVLPVVTVVDADQGEAVALALARGGITCVEITFRTDGAAAAIARIAALEGVAVGAGTVVSPEQADAALAAGARFAVAPALDERVVEYCRDLGLPFIPGVATPSEVARARSLGLRLVKVFPAAQLGGPAFVRSIAAVFPDVHFLPTGGVDVATLAEYLAIPSVLACGGSWMVAPALLRSGRFDEVERLAHEAVQVAR
jgi:2-dehydro-3-deoxyphosphogluconate aldolase/(4S)-4-hydroxy-2-oxoglutarate aldolase